MKSLWVRAGLAGLLTLAASVAPVASSLVICSRATGCCRITLPLLKSHEGCGPTECSHT